MSFSHVLPKKDLALTALTFLHATHNSWRVRNLIRCIWKCGTILQFDATKILQKKNRRYEFRQECECPCQAVMQNVKCFYRHCRLQPIFGDENSLLFSEKTCLLKRIIPSWLELPPEGKP